MAMDPNEVFINVGDELRGEWPEFMPRPAVLDDLWVGTTTLERDEARNVLFVDTRLLLPTQVAFFIPGVDDVGIVLGARNRETILPIRVELRPEPMFRMENVPLAIRLPAALLKPVRRAESSGSDQPAIWEVDPTREFPDITIADATFEVDGDGNIDFTVEQRVDLPPVMLGDSGVVIEARDVTFHLDPRDPPDGQSPGFRGVFMREATLALPGELGELVGVLSVENAYISNGGFTGSVSDEFAPAKEVEFFGLALKLEEVSVSLVQNAFTGASMRGRLTLPFFDEEVEVEIGFTINGDFNVRLSDPSGIITLEKAGLFRLAVESLGFEVEGGLFRTVLSGTLTPTIQADALDWPTFDVRELSIDARGRVQLEGGWLSLPSALTLDFFGFQIEITKLGFGQNDDGGKWVGMNGALRLVDGLQAGASVEGLRLTWYDDGRAPALSLEGVGVELEIPNALRFKGFVAFRELPGGVRRFDGNIELELLALNLSVDAELVFGHASAPDGSYNFMGIFLGVELPAGIPLFTTGLGLYGMAGLFASQLTPDKAPDEPWYGGESGGWYKRDPEGVTALTQKWTNQRDALGLGVGVTLGTLADNGYAFSGRLLLLLLFPGPVIMIEGRANLLKERSKLNAEPLFKTLAVLDFNVGTFLFGVEAQFRYDDGGRLLEIGGSAEAYFNINNPGDWHFWLGQREPRDKRIRARIFQLFEANTYFMLDASSLAMGAWFGYDKTWKFGPLRVSAELWAEGHAGVSWRPPQFTGGVRVHGGVHLRAFGIGLGLSVEVGLEATVFDPFHIIGDFRVKLRTPWPLPDIGATVTLEWGPEPVWPKVPLPLAEVAIEHIKVSTAWPLPRNTGLLEPSYDSGGGLRDIVNVPIPEPPDAVRSAPPPENAPVVPMDARPRLTFARQVHDDALVGVNGRVPPEREIIGDPSNDRAQVRVRYGLREVVLEKWAGSGWSAVARKAAADMDPNADGVDVLYGSWAPIPDFTATDGTGDAGGHSQVKLWLWSANPFDYTRRVGRAWDEWFTDQYDNYPCIAPDTPKARCYDFETTPLSTPLDNGPSSVDPYVPSYRHPDNPAVEIIVDDAVLAGVPSVQALPAPLDGHLRGVSFTGLPSSVPNTPPPPTASPLINDILVDLLEVAPIPAGNKALLVLLPLPNAGVRLVISSAATVFAYDEGNVQHVAPPRTGDVAEIVASNLKLVVAYWNTDISFAGVCHSVGPTAEQAARVQLVAQHNVEAVEHFEERGFVLESHTNYRLRIVTQIDANGERALSRTSPNTRQATQIEFAFFRTEGPPKLANLTLPLGREMDEQIHLRNAQGQLIRNDGTLTAGPPVLASELNGLGIYVRQTLPATIPASKQQPDLPRPVYRGYDLGVEFNENYVQLMYRLDGRDLALYLFDQNEVPVRDADGRIIVLRAGWGVADQPTVDTSELVWTTTLKSSSCAGSLDVELSRDEELMLPGTTLEPDTIYDASLNPLLLHEDFANDDLYVLGASASGTGAVLGRWEVEDQGGGSGASQWMIAERGAPATRLVTQTSDYFAGPIDGRIPEKPGTILWLRDRAVLPADHADQPSRWTDYRFSVIVRAEDDDAVGVVFRRSSPSRYYRFSMDRERKYRRLTLHFDGAVEILAEDEFAYQQSSDYELVIEALGQSLAVYQDGELVFRVTEGSVLEGTIGLYCWGVQAASFADVRVDDFRLTSRSAFLYRFTTSRFSNFAHQVHSYQDETWTREIDAAAVGLLASAVPAAQPAAAAEHRAWDAFEASPAIDELVRVPVDELQVTRLLQAGQTRAFLLRSPEPIDVQRTRVDVWRSAARGATRAVPGQIKLAAVSRHATDPNQESVSLMLRDGAELSGASIEQRTLPPLLLLPGAGASLLDERFIGQESGRLFREAFGPNALDFYEIIDQGTSSPPSSWSMDGDAIVQSSNIFSPPNSAANLAKLGTLAIRESDDWANVRLHAVLLSNDDDSIGLVFRYRDADNYYRFELNRNFGYWRLIKRQAGEVVLLAQDTSRGYEPGLDNEIDIVAVGSQLVGYVNHVLAFVTDDASLELGRVGLYCWGNQGLRVKALSVHAAERPPVLLATPATLANQTVIDEGSTGGPGDWQVSGSAITQGAPIQSPDDGSGKFPGTNLIAGRLGWEDVQASVRVTTTSGRAVGVLVRFRDIDNYYRLSFDATAGYRRFVKVEAGATTVLWQDTAVAAAGEGHDVTLSAQGRRLRAWLDGVLLFDVNDSAHPAGQVGLYTWNDASARFEGWAVIDDTREVGAFQIVDEGQLERPSDWRITSGALRQGASISDGQSDPALPEKLGTMAIAGDPAWSDYRISTEVRSDGGSALGVVFRYVDQNNYYRLSLDAARSYRRLIRKLQGVVSVLWQDSGGYGRGSDFSLTIDAVGSRLSGYQGSAVLFSLDDDSLPAGRVGLYTWGNDDVRFSRFHVSHPSVEAATLFRDRFEAGNLDDWTSVDTGTISAPSRWLIVGGRLHQDSNIHSEPTAGSAPEKEGTYLLAGDPAWNDIVLRVRVESQDDDAVGVMFRVIDNDNYYRFSMDRGRSYRRLVRKQDASFEVLWEDNVAYELGRTYELVIVARGDLLEGYLDGVLVFSVNDAAHAQGRIALYCWGNSDATFSNLRVYAGVAHNDGALVRDEFSVLRDVAYTFEDEGTLDGPSVWAANDGKLLQTSSIRGADPVALAGSNAVLNGVDVADFRASVVVRSTSGGGMGLVFRSGAGGYYRFALDRGNGTRYLLRKVGATFSVIFSESFQFQLGVAYALTVECFGPQLVGYVNGVRVFSLNDESHANGSVGLYVANNPSAEFERLAVSPADWVPLYRFGSERQAPAGTRLRIFSGSASQPFAADPLETVRHVAAPFELGEVQLEGGVAELRVVERGQPSHRREFVADASWTPVEARVLRRADGTSHVFIPSDGGSFPRSDYRFRFEYRRGEPGPTLSERGQTTPEVVQIDVPWDASNEA